METYSFVIPCYNEEADIAATIAACLDQDFDDSYEVIIIDDASNDSTAQVINSFNDYRIKYLRNKINKGVAYSRNRGIQVANGSVIAFINADELPGRNYLKCVNRLFSGGADYIFPQTIVKNIDTPYGLYRQAYRLYTYYRNNLVMWSQGFCCKKTVLERVGLFRECYPGCGGEDWDIVTKIDQMAFCRVVDLSIVVHHTLPCRRSAIVWHMFNRGRGTAYYDLYCKQINPSIFLLEKIIKTGCLVGCSVISIYCLPILLILYMINTIKKITGMLKVVSHPKAILWIPTMEIVNSIIRTTGYYHTIIKAVLKI